MSYGPLGGTDFYSRDILQFSTWASGPNSTMDLNTSDVRHLHRRCTSEAEAE